jgi:hypothetical protein
MATRFQVPSHLEVAGTDDALEVSAADVNLSGTEWMESSQSHERWAMMTTEDTYVPRA